MSTLELKIQLINWLTELKDKNLLSSLASIKDSEQSDDWYKQLNPKQRKSLDRGIDDHKKPVSRRAYHPPAGHVHLVAVGRLGCGVNKSVMYQGKVVASTTGNHAPAGRR